MRKRDMESLKGCPLFAEVPDELLAEWVAAPGVELAEPKKGETVLSTLELHRCLGVVLRGSAMVHKVCECGRRIIMSRLAPGDAFGMATLFYEAEALPTEIEALTGCRLLMFPKERAEAMLAQDAAFARAYITLLSEKIHFLTRRLGNFAEVSAEEKLLGVLAGFWVEGDRLEIPYSMTQLADVLGVGRASLYRAFDELEEQGVLTRRGNTVILHRPERLNIPCPEPES